MGKHGAAAMEWNGCSEAQLIAGLAQHKAGAFDELLHRYQSYLMSQCKRLCRGNQGASEDLYGMTILHLLMEDSANLANIKHLGGWLKQVTLCKYIDQQRKQAAESEKIKKYVFEADIGTASTQTPDELYFRSQIASHLERVISALPDSLKDVAVFRYLDDLPSRDIAACMGLSDDVVRKRLQLARTSMKKSLKSILTSDFHYSPSISIPNLHLRQTAREGALVE